MDAKTGERETCADQAIRLACYAVHDFAPRLVAARPDRRGMLVAMTAGFHHEHAVLRVESGTRLTMPSFMTFDASKADRSLLLADATG